MKVSEKYYDELFDFKGEWDVPSRCGLRILDKQGHKYVIVIELYQDNQGTSVASAGKSLMLQICSAKGLDPAAVTYLECNPDTHSKLSFYDEEYFEVTFKDGDQFLNNADYRLLSSGEVKFLLTGQL
jgi:hypothetical protein